MPTMLRSASPTCKDYRGFSLIELLIVVAIILVVAAIAIPNLMNARRSANEASATASMRTISSAQLIYRSSQGLFTDLTGLSQDSVIDGVLGTGAKSGYTFVSVTGTNPANQFTAFAAPILSLGANATGKRTFFTDETQVIRFEISAPATSSSPPIGN